MFTIKLYENGQPSTPKRIISAESFTIDDVAGTKQVVIHQPGGQSTLAAIKAQGEEGESFYIRAIIENASGKTCEVIVGNKPLRDLFENAPAPKEA